MSKLSNVGKKFKLSFFLIHIFTKLCLISHLLLSKSAISQLFCPSMDYAIKINLIGVLLLHTIVSSFTVISAYFKICNNDNRSVTSSIVLLLLLLSLNMFFFFLIFLLDKLCFIALFVYILCGHNSASIVMVIH